MYASKRLDIMVILAIFYLFSDNISVKPIGIDEKNQFENKKKMS